MLQSDLNIYIYRDQHLHAFSRLNVMIYLVHNPAEQAAVERLGQRVPHLTGLHHIALSLDLFAPGHVHIRSQRIVEILLVELKQITYCWKKFNFSEIKILLYATVLPFSIISGFFIWTASLLLNFLGVNTISPISIMLTNILTRLSMSYKVFKIKLNWIIRTRFQILTSSTKPILCMLCLIDKYFSSFSIDKQVAGLVLDMKRYLSGDLSRP